MSSIKDKPVKLTLNGVTYDLVFNLNVMEDVFDQYESFEALNRDLISKKDKARIKAIKVTLKALIDDAVSFHNETHTEKLSHLSIEQIGRLLKKRDMPVIVGIILEAQSRAMPEVNLRDGKTEGESKNSVTT